MAEVAKSDLSTGNKTYASSVVRSNEIVIAFTAPYNHTAGTDGSSTPHPNYSASEARDFILKHGLAVRAIGILVNDAKDAYNQAVTNGAIGVMPPQEVTDVATGTSQVISEIKHSDDVVLRFVSGNFAGPFIPNYAPVNNYTINYGLTRIDHIVTNVPDLFDQVEYTTKVTGFHEFSEFTAEDVGTVDSGLNSMVTCALFNYTL